MALGEVRDACMCAVEQDGQSTVEYAVVLAAGLSVVVALGVLWHAARGGALLGLVERACAYALGGDSALGAWQDVLLF